MVEGKNTMEYEIVIKKPIGKVYGINGKLCKSIDYLGGIIDDTKIFTD